MNASFGGRITRRTPAMIAALVSLRLHAKTGYREVVIQCQRISDTAGGHHHKAHGIDHRERLITESCEPLRHRATFDLRRTLHDDIRWLSDKANEGEARADPRSTEQKRVRLRDHQVRGDHALVSTNRSTFTARTILRSLLVVGEYAVVFARGVP